MLVQDKAQAKKVYCASGTAQTVVLHRAARVHSRERVLFTNLASSIGIEPVAALKAGSAIQSEMAPAAATLVLFRGALARALAAA